MFNIHSYPEIEQYIKTTLKRYKPSPSGWIETFCPYCNDSTRKFNPTGGHFHIAESFTFCHCFRCGTQIGLDRFLIDIGFKNQSILQQIKNISGFTYNKSKITGIYHSLENINDVVKKIIKQHLYIRINFPKEFNEYSEYIHYRCLDIDPVKFFLTPVLSSLKKIQLRIMNYNGEIVSTRNITDDTYRYEISKGTKKYYYFQDIMNIDKYKNIIIMEGAIDCINLYNYYYPFKKDSFFISIGGNNYKGTVIDIINKFLLIGKYKIIVVFDKGVKFQDKIIKSIINQVNILNPEIICDFYIPVIGKDVSEIMMLDKLEN